MKNYQDFLAGKAIRASERGLDRVPELAPHLFPFQRECVAFALRAGASGCFLDTGLGKTEVQLEWCQRAIEATNAKALIWTPLAVAGQTKRRAERWGYQATIIREQADVRPGINICNYDRRDKIDPQAFDIVACDEASILKSFSSKTTVAMTEAFRGHRFKLVATATPAPNDHMEIGNYADFLDVMSGSEMLSRFFINDTSTASRSWRLKGHAVDAFWDWLASWARVAEKPSDLTGNASHDTAFVLPALEIIKHRARNSNLDQDFSELFGAPKMSATSIFDIKRQTAGERAKTVGDIIHKEINEHTILKAEKIPAWVLWCDTNEEQNILENELGQLCISIRGSQSADEKETLHQAWIDGVRPVLLTKPSMFGFGCDWSHCARMAFVGRSYSYETWYQAIRRCWRFGQKQKVIVHLIVAEGETEIGRVIDRKSVGHLTMKLAMAAAMRRSTGRSSDVRVAYQPTHTARLASWLSAV